MAVIICPNGALTVVIQERYSQPSAPASRLPASAAGNPAALSPRDGRPGPSAEGARGQAGDDAALGEQDQQGDGNRDDDHRRVDEVVEGLVAALAEGGDGQGGGEVRLAGQERDREREVVPGQDEGQDRGGEHAGDGDGDDHLAQRLQPGGAVGERGVLEILGYLLEEVLQQPGGDGQGVDQVDEDQRVDAVQRADGLEDQEDRPDHGQHGEEPGQQDEREDRARPADVQAGQRVAGAGRDDDRDHGGGQRDDDAVQQRGQELLLGEHVHERLTGQVPGDDAVLAAHPGGDLAVGLQRGAQDPVEREQRDQHHDDDRDVEQRLPDDLPGGDPATVLQYGGRGARLRDCGSHGLTLLRLWPQGGTPGRRWRTRSGR